MPSERNYTHWHVTIDIQTAIYTYIVPIPLLFLQKKQELKLFQGSNQTGTFLKLQRLSHIDHPVPRCRQENLPFPISIEGSKHHQNQDHHFSLKNCIIVVYDPFTLRKHYLFILLITKLL